MRYWVRFVLILSIALLFAGIIAGVGDWQSVYSAQFVVLNAPSSQSVDTAYVPQNEPVDGTLQPAASLNTSPPIPITGHPAPAVAYAVSQDNVKDDLVQQRSEFLALRAIPTATSIPTVMPGSAFEASELFVHIPPQANREKPLRVLLALHGMGGQGISFAQELIKTADKHNWVVIAPTLPYNSQWIEPKLLLEDDVKLSKRLVDTLIVLPQRLNVKFQPQIMVFGFSRGAQLAHHLAYFYPEQVESVVTISAGAYTMPDENGPIDKGAPVVPLPFGVGDLTQTVGRPMNWKAFKEISFWISVGARDNRAEDVSRAFDPYCGKTRVDRAQAFQKALASLKLNVHLVVFPDTGHEVTQEMRQDALKFLREDELSANLNN